MSTDPMTAAAQAGYEQHRGARADWPAWDELGDDGRARWVRTITAAVKAHGKTTRQAAKARPAKVPPIPLDVREAVTRSYDLDGIQTWVDGWQTATPDAREHMMTMARRLA